MAFKPIEERVYKRMGAQEGLIVRRDASGDLLVDAAIPGMSDANGRPRSVTVDRYSAWESIIEIAFGRYFMSLAWCALYLALLTGEKARAAERREGAFRRAAKAAELRSLRYQVNPHFLFNTFNSLSALVLTGKTAAAERMIQTISTFYRRSLADDPTSDVPLREEFALQKLYLDIETVRFPDRLKAEYDLPDSLAGALVPGMILQPLVENSVKHAVAPASRKVTITLSAREEYGRLVVTVADDGAGAVRDSARPRDGFGIGLGNVHDRLAARFGDEASVVSGPTSSGYATQIRIPLMGEARHAA
jgi:two-component system, LytTR family, sensor kinase